MKFCSMNGPSESEVESLLMSPCWGPTQTGSQDQYLLDGHKLLLEHELDSLPSDADAKNSLDVLDNLLLNSSSLNALSDLKPLPPFTNYTGHLSINGISGHHYHAIAQRLPDESNNNYIQSAYQLQQHQQQQQQQQQHQQQQQQNGSSNGATSLQQQHTNMTNNNNNNNNNNSSHSSNNITEHNIVSSSTCLPESVLSGGGGGGTVTGSAGSVINDSTDACLNDVKLFADSQLDSKLYAAVAADSCIGLPNGNGGGVGLIGAGASLTPTLDHVADTLHTSSVRIYKDLTEYVDMNSIDDIAAIIGSAIADTTVPNQLDKDDGNDTRDSWMDLDAWIDGNCIQQTDGKLVVTQQDVTLNDFMLPSHSPVHAPSSSTLQSLLTHGYMPLLHNRLQNGPPSAANGANGNTTTTTTTTTCIKSETPSSSTSYCNELTTATASSSSPPGSVVSTTDNLMINPRYLTNQSSQHTHAHAYQLGGNGNGSSSSNGLSDMKSEVLCSTADMLGNYPHTTTVTPSTGTPKTKRSRSQKNKQQQQQTTQQQQQNNGGQNSGLTQLCNPSQLNSISASNVNAFNASNANDLSGLLGKEKPVHRCSICNRGFLNKSNIKVHLRTHTGEKPFRCDVCAKAFRQKAHLLKHQQIHKRIGRD